MISLIDVQKSIYGETEGPPMLPWTYDDPAVVRPPPRKRRKIKDYNIDIPVTHNDTLEENDLPASSLPDGFPPELAFRALAAYSLIRTLSTKLGLSPFTPNVFLRALYLPVPNSLLGQIHVILLRFLLKNLQMGYHWGGKNSRSHNPFIWVNKKRKVDGLLWPLRAGDDLKLLDMYTWPVFFDDYCHLTADILYASINSKESYVDFRTIDTSGIRTEPRDEKQVKRKAKALERVQSPVVLLEEDDEALEEVDSDEEYRIEEDEDEDFVPIPSKRRRTGQLVDQSISATRSRRQLHTSKHVKESKTSSSLPGAGTLSISKVCPTSLPLTDYNYAPTLRSTGLATLGPHKQMQVHGMLPPLQPNLKQDHDSAVRQPYPAYTPSRPVVPPIAPQHQPGCDLNFHHPINPTSVVRLTQDRNQPAWAFIGGEVPHVPQSFPGTNDGIKQLMKRSPGAAEQRNPSQPTSTQGQSIEDVADDEAGQPTIVIPVSSHRVTAFRPGQRQAQACDMPSNSCCPLETLRCGTVPESDTLRNPCEMIPLQLAMPLKNELDLKHELKSEHAESIIASSDSRLGGETSIAAIEDSLNLLQQGTPKVPLESVDKSAASRVPKIPIMAERHCGSADRLATRSVEYADMHGHEEVPNRGSSPDRKSPLSLLQDYIQSSTDVVKCCTQRDASAKYSRDWEELEQTPGPSPWCHFDALKAMRLGTPYHRLSVHQKLDILEFLVDELVCIETIAYELERRELFTKQFELPYGKLPSNDELNNLINDDQCAICELGGDLLCCDGCIASYHNDCVNMPVLPEGCWKCPECTLISPAKFGPLFCGQKASLDWFTSSDVQKRSETNTIALPVCEAVDFSCDQRLLCRFMRVMNETRGPEFLVIHGFVFRRNNSDLKQIVPYCDETVSPELLSEKDLHDFLAMLGPGVASSWPLSQIPRNDIYMKSPDAFNPIAYRSQYREVSVPAHANGPGDPITNSCNALSGPIPSKNSCSFLTKDMSFDSIIFRALLLQPLLYDSYQFTKSFVLKLEGDLSKAYLIDTFWGHQASSGDRKWAKAVERCRSVRKLCQLVVTLVDAAHPRAFSEKWYQPAKSKLQEFSPIVDALTEDDEVLTLQSSFDGTIPASLSEKRRWDRCANSCLPLLLSREKSDIFEWIRSVRPDLAAALPRQDKRKHSSRSRKPTFRSQNTLSPTMSSQGALEDRHPLVSQDEHNMFSNNAGKRVASTALRNRDRNSRPNYVAMTKESIEALIVEKRTEKANALLEDLKVTLTRELHWPIAGRHFFDPIGYLPRADVRRLARNGGKVAAPWLTYSVYYEVGQASIFHVWRKRMLFCTSFEDLMLLMRMLESFLQWSASDFEYRALCSYPSYSCIVFQVVDKSTGKAISCNSGKSGPRTILCTQREMISGIDYHLVAETRHDRTTVRWSSALVVELGCLIQHRWQKRSLYLDKYKKKCVSQSTSNSNKMLPLVNSFSDTGGCKERNGDQIKHSHNVHAPSLATKDHKHPTAMTMHPNENVSAQKAYSTTSTMIHRILDDHVAEVKSLLKQYAITGIPFFEIEPRRQQRMALIRVILSSSGLVCSDNEISEQLTSSEGRAYQQCGFHGWSQSLARAVPSTARLLHDKPQFVPVLKEASLSASTKQARGSYIDNNMSNAFQRHPSRVINHNVGIQSSASAITGRGAAQAFDLSWAVGSTQPMFVDQGGSSSSYDTARIAGKKLPNQQHAAHLLNAGLPGQGALNNGGTSEQNRGRPRIFHSEIRQSLCQSSTLVPDMSAYGQHWKTSSDKPLYSSRIRNTVGDTFCQARVPSSDFTKSKPPFGQERSFHTGISNQASQERLSRFVPATYSGNGNEAGIVEPAGLLRGEYFVGSTTTPNFKSNRGRHLESHVDVTPTLNFQSIKHQARPDDRIAEALYTNNSSHGLPPRHGSISHNVTGHFHQSFRAQPIAQVFPVGQDNSRTSNGSFRANHGHGTLPVQYQYTGSSFPGPVLSGPTLGSPSAHVAGSSIAFEATRKTTNQLSRTRLDSTMGKMFKPNSAGL